MAQTKIYPATKQQAENIQDTVDEINSKVDSIDSKVEPLNLADVVDGVLDFVNDPITITSGGLDSTRRIIST